MLPDKDLNELYEQLKIDEGIKLKPYVDTVGKITIGIGRNLADCGISTATAIDMLKEDVSNVQNSLASKIENYENFPVEVRSILCNMCFNLGIGGLLKFERTLEAIKNGKYNEAAMDMEQSKWAEEVGDRAKRLIARMRVL